jgi:hypothetical protein
MQSTHFKTVAEKPFFPMVLAEESSEKDPVHFFRSRKKHYGVEIKVYFTFAKIFLIYMKDRRQQKVEVRLRTPQTSLIGEVERLMEMSS